MAHNLAEFLKAVLGDCSYAASNIVQSEAHV